ncbi:rubrerythrin family protein [Saccharopolyspora rhizosphaerae]|uniref:Rubrerythrin family protein n=1 Tax=Saccharopolyspora rhizosphaerae TaxID=2492662 RepID=A0A3R8R7Y1_9PSEU|nr:VIT1/CCC1 family protein [Saccharopolyspora rhizosphaerae]RRO20456.1 rubrerythrin family protein [Saccharopolyspora rhizosphaerae]
MQDKITDSRSIRRWRRRLADEREEARVYRSLAARRSGEEREILLGLAEAEERHARFWEGLLGDEIGPHRRGQFRMRILVALARRFGSVFVLALAQRAESRSPYRYDQDVPASMAADERIHEEVVRALAARGRARVSGSFRAAVFGANDGLVSNLALVLGVIGGNVPSDVVLLTGLAGLLAGALSMGAGEYISVRSQRELLSAARPDPRARAVVADLDFDANELALVYRARGMDEEEAHRRADALLSKIQLNLPARHEGAEPTAEDAHGGQDRSSETTDGHEVVGTAMRAALSSFVFFASGALVPVLPFAAGLTGVLAVVLAVVLVGIALMLTGATVGVLSGAAPLPRAVRQLAIGLGAAAVTYLLGVLFGATVG